MLYLISDIHGRLKDFKRLLAMINFDHSNDKLIILGDIVDRGPEGIEALEYVMPYIGKSMSLLRGNHEEFAQMYLMGELSERTWTCFGGGGTLRSIKQMSDEQRSNLLEFLKGLKMYEEISSSTFGKVIVTHTGIDCDNYVLNDDKSINVVKSIDRALERNRYNYIVGTDLHYVPASDLKRLDRFLIVGHVPCNRINEDGSNKFIRTKYYMDIDAGAGHKEQGGVLGCYCVDTDKEIYLK